jgi:S-adenosylmethionine-diacylglycerol 3-amino-3-carboxypropyl transferase
MNIANKIFNKIHSSNLIYNCCWEDPNLDRKALNLNHDSKVMVITSAGCNALDYAIAGAGHVYAVDMNFRQNALLELKLVAARALDYEDFFLMFGHGVLYQPEITYKEKFRDQLSFSSQEFWDENISYFHSKGFRNSFYFHGTSGMVARLMKLYLENILGAKQTIKNILEADSLEEQRQIYFTELKPKICNYFFRKVSGSLFVMSLLGVPKAQVEQVNKYHPRGMSGFIEDSLDSVFGNLSLKNNYFWRVYLQGHYDRDACPEYLTKAGYSLIKELGNKKISIHTSTITNFLKQQADSTISHFVLLDHMDWLYSNLSDELVKEWSEIIRVATKDATIIFRSGGFKVEYLDDILLTKDNHRIRLKELLEFNQQLANELHPQDRVHTYGSFYVANLKI